mmetsp:Transcript_33374/g.46230  ORF Transcript_33374/g.46230 Transcript_33374/m.46230 type:complete len:179 (+) Transcript_33374:137-673(+)
MKKHRREGHFGVTQADRESMASDQLRDRMETIARAIAHLSPQGPRIKIIVDMLPRHEVAQTGAVHRPAMEDFIHIRLWKPTASGSSSPTWPPHQSSPLLENQDSVTSERTIDKVRSTRSSTLIATSPDAIELEYDENENEYESKMSHPGALDIPLKRSNSHPQTGGGKKKTVNNTALR